MFDPELGFDPQVAYCANSCGRLAVLEQFEGFMGEDEIVYLVCYESTIGLCVDTNPST